MPFPVFRRAVLLVGLAVSLVSPMAAQAQKSVVTRTVTVYAAGLSSSLPMLEDSTLPMGIPGYSGSIRTYNFLRPDDTGGYYWYAAGSSIVHQIGKITIGDTHPIGAGWRGEIAKGISLDLGASAVAGSRIKEKFVFVDLFVGLSPLAGLSFKINDSLDVGIMGEPVFMLYPFDSAFVATRDYLNLSLCVSVKSHREIKTLKWEEGAL